MIGAYFHDGGNSRLSNKDYHGGMATSVDQKNFIKTALRLPPELHAAVHESAQKNGRSYNAELIALIGAGLAGADLPPKLRRDLELAATRNGRSLQGEIVDRLQGSFGPPPSPYEPERDVDFLYQVMDAQAKLQRLTMELGAARDEAAFKAVAVSRADEAYKRGLAQRLSDAEIQALALAENQAAKEYRAAAKKSQDLIVAVRDQESELRVLYGQRSKDAIHRAARAKPKT